MQGTIIARSDGESIAFETDRVADADTYITYGELYPSRTFPVSAGEESNGEERSLQDADSSEASSEYNLLDDEETRTYILNTSSHLIHIPSCESVEKMSEKNKLEVTGTLEDILTQYQGFRPCERCNAGQ